MSDIRIIEVGVPTPVTTVVVSTGIVGPQGLTGAAGADGPAGQDGISPPVAGEAGQVQYSDGAGNLAASSALVFDNTTGALSLAGPLVVDAPTGTVLPIDMQVDGISRFSVSGAGKIEFGPYASKIYSFDNAGGNLSVNANGGVFKFGYEGWLGFGSLDDAKLYRVAANSLGLRNGTDLQKFTAYASYTDASNWRGTAIYGNGTITTEGAGTGATPTSLNFQSTGSVYLNAASSYDVLLNAGSTGWLVKGVSGALMPGGDNIQDVGTWTAKVRHVIAGSQISCGTFFTFGTKSLMSSPLDGNIVLSNNAQATFDRLQFGGTSNLFPALRRSNAGLDVVTADGLQWAQLHTGYIQAEGTIFGLGLIKAGTVLQAGSLGEGYWTTTYLGLQAASYLGWAAAGDASGLKDLKLYRGGSGILEQRNGINAQAFHVYGTYTDASNYIRGFARWASDTYEVGTEFAGTGGARNLRLRADGNAGVYFSTSGVDRWSVSGGGHLVAAGDGLYDIGAAGAARPRHVTVAYDITAGRTGYFGTSVFIGNAEGYLTPPTTAGAVGIRAGRTNGDTVFLGSYGSMISGVIAGSGGLIGFSGGNTVGGATAPVDAVNGVYFARVSASEIEINNGTAGVSRGLRARDLTLYQNSLWMEMVSRKAIILGSNAKIYWSAGADTQGVGQDIELHRDGAGTLAQRSGTIAQALKLYGTYTDASNYKRFALGWTGASEFTIGPETAGTGTDLYATLHLKSGYQFKITSGYGLEAITSNMGFHFARGMISLGNNGGYDPVIKTCAVGAAPVIPGNLFGVNTNVWLMGMTGGPGYASTGNQHKGTGIVLYAGAGATPGTEGAGGNAGDIEVRLNAGGAQNTSGGDGANSLFKITTGTAATGPTVFSVDYLGTVMMPNLPTVNPGVAGALWNNGGVLSVS